jgi:hypothetical protein
MIMSTQTPLPAREAIARVTTELIGMSTAASRGFIQPDYTLFLGNYYTENHPV